MHSTLPQTLVNQDIVNQHRRSLLADSECPSTHIYSILKLDPEPLSIRVRLSGRCGTLCLRERYSVRYWYMRAKVRGKWREAYLSPEHLLLCEDIRNCLSSLYLEA